MRALLTKKHKKFEITELPEPALDWGREPK
jgi:hypothetical protein